MQRALKFALLAASLATVPYAAAILSSTSLIWSRTLKPRVIDMSFSGARGITAAADDGYELNAPITQAQAMDLFWGPAGADVPGGWPPPVPHPPGPFGFGARPGPPSPQTACEEDVDRLIGLAGYLKSKMRLQNDQKIAWQKVEQAAAPGAERLRNLCEHLPSQPVRRPDLLEHIDFAEMQMAARLELLRAIHEPLHALHETLSSDQRALLAAGPQLIHPLPPPPPDLRR